MKKIILTVCSVIVAVVAAFAFIWILDNRLPAFSKPGTIYIYPGTSQESLFDQVCTELQPKHKKSILRVMKTEDVAGRMHQGMFSFNTHQPARYFARAVTRGWQTPTNLVLSGSMRSSEIIASKIGSQMMIDSASFMNALNDSSLLASLGIPASQIFGFIIPDTYQMYWDAPATIILKRLKKEYDLFWNEERCAAAKAQGLTPRQVSILASIIAQESNKPDEYPKIASVYLTRLRRGMKLQACPTICYIYGYSINRVLYRHLRTDSPYNTYKYPGLPPTPICVPGKEHIDAVLHPDSTPYLYFCADASFNGRNVFSRTYEEHLRNASAYQTALDRRMEQCSQARDSVSSSVAAIFEQVVPAQPLI